MIDFSLNDSLKETYVSPLAGNLHSSLLLQFAAVKVSLAAKVSLAYVFTSIGMETFNMILAGVSILNSYRSMKVNGYDTNALDGIGNGFHRKMYINTMRTLFST